MNNSKSNKQYPIGFTAVDNRAFYLQDSLSPSAFSIFIRIYRMSEGYDGKPKSLSNTYFQKSCNISKNTITKAVKELELLGIINTQRRSRSNTLYSINLDRINTIYLSNPDNDSQELNIVGTKTVLSDSQEVCSTKENLIKQNNNKENINIPFDSFWDLYDYKKNKADCNTKWLSMTDEERQLTMDTLCTYIKSTPDKMYRKYPLNYLENEMWLDEVVLTVKDDSTGVFSASHKEFKPLISASNTVTDSTSPNTDNTSVDTSLDLLAKSSQIQDALTKASQTHWSELKAKGLLKKQVNPSTSMISTEKQKEIDDFLNNNGSKRFSNSRVFKDVV